MYETFNMNAGYYLANIMMLKWENWNFLNDFFDVGFLKFTLQTSHMFFLVRITDSRGLTLPSTKLDFCSYIQFTECSELKYHNDINDILDVEKSA